MKESVLDILIHLFENFLDTDDEPEPSRDALKLELERAGYPEPEVERALCWLDGLAEDRVEGMAEAAPRSMRVYNAHELSRLDTALRGYLLHLEQIGILSGAQRELVIDRLLALDTDDIDTEQMKWVVLMVLFSQPGQEQAYERMEDLVFEARPEAVH
jgi:Smg protein